jgi:hypothetical protein
MFNFGMTFAQGGLAMKSGLKDISNSNIEAMDKVAQFGELSKITDTFQIKESLGGEVAWDGARPQFDTDSQVEISKILSQGNDKSTLEMFREVDQKVATLTDYKTTPQEGPFSLMAKEAGGYDQLSAEQLEQGISEVDEYAAKQESFQQMSRQRNSKFDEYADLDYA